MYGAPCGEEQLCRHGIWRRPWWLSGDHPQVLSPAVPSDLSSLATNLFGCRDSCSLWQGSFGDICASLRDRARDCPEQG